MPARLQSTKYHLLNSLDKFSVIFLVDKLKKKDAKNLPVRFFSAKLS